jgi:hypothetical protein
MFYMCYFTFIVYRELKFTNDVQMLKSMPVYIYGNEHNMFLY